MNCQRTIGPFLTYTYAVRRSDQPLDRGCRQLKRLAGFSRLYFPWPYDRRTLWVEFYRLQTAAKVKPDGKTHYGFHDLRRAFATMNASNMTADALQHLMRHRSYATTQRYISMSRQINPAVARLFVPELGATSGG
jgi:integrase